jgi:hypothetical protein
MYTFRYAVLVSLLMFAASSTYATEFAKELANQKEAEAQGLQRVNLEELKKFIPGEVRVRDFKGKKRILTYNSDGSVDRKDQTGKWNFDEGKNAYCVLFEDKKFQKGNVRSEKHCFAVFRAKDGINFYDFDVENGFFSHVWHPGE